MALRLLLPLLLMAATLLIAQAQGIGSSALDCCMNYSRNTIPISVVKSYSIQRSDSECFLHAVVFTTKKGKKICASPNDPSIQKLMQILDKKVKNNKKKGQTPRPKGRSKRQKRQRV